MWAVLQLLWERGPSTIRQLTEVLYPKQAASDHATVHRLLERLEQKGYVTRERGGAVQVFQAVRDREAVVGEQLEALVERAGGSLQPLLTSLIRGGRLTAAELRELRDLVNTLNVRNRRKQGPS
jgi:BlaI family transcriptional regulator, penicillinase repressor